MTAKQRKLAAFVHVRDDKGNVGVFGPDDDVPDWAVAAITNPAAWETAPAEAKSKTDK